MVPFERVGTQGFGPLNCVVSFGQVEQLGGVASLSGVGARRGSIRDTGAVTLPAFVRSSIAANAKGRGYDAKNQSYSSS
jgi:hypothetical protein